MDSAQGTAGLAPPQTDWEKAVMSARKRPGQWGRARDIFDWMVQDGYFTENDREIKERSLTGRLAEDQKRSGDSATERVMLFERKYVNNSETGAQFSMYTILDYIPCVECGKYSEDEQTGEIYLCSNEFCREGWHSQCLNPPTVVPSGEEWYCPKCSPLLRQNPGTHAQHNTASDTYPRTQEARQEAQASGMPPPPPMNKWQSLQDFIKAQPVFEGTLEWTWPGEAPCRGTVTLKRKEKTHIFCSECNEAFSGDRGYVKRFTDHLKRKGSGTKKPNAMHVRMRPTNTEAEVEAGDSEEAAHAYTPRRRSSPQKRCIAVLSEPETERSSGMNTEMGAQVLRGMPMGHRDKRAASGAPQSSDPVMSEGNGQDGVQSEHNDESSDDDAHDSIGRSPFKQAGDPSATNAAPESQAASCVHEVASRPQRPAEQRQPPADHPDNGVPPSDSIQVQLLDSILNKREPKPDDLSKWLEENSEGRTARRDLSRWIRSMCKAVYGSDYHSKAKHLYIILKDIAIGDSFPSQNQLELIIAVNEFIAISCDDDASTTIQDTTYVVSALNDMANNWSNKSACETPTA